MSNKHSITAADILPSAVYALARADWRKKMTALKRLRRVQVGPFVTFYFESYDTMWHQIQEMLFIEKGGPAQIPDELDAYNPLEAKADLDVVALRSEFGHGLAFCGNSDIRVRQP